MTRRAAPEYDASSLTHECAAWRMLDVLRQEHDADVEPRMIMERPVVIAFSELMQVDIEPLVLRNDIPAEQIAWTDIDAHGTIARISFEQASHEAHCPIPARRIRLI